jgi:hypothetical protein
MNEALVVGLMLWNVSQRLVELITLQGLFIVLLFFVCSFVLRQCSGWA